MLRISEVFAQMTQIVPARETSISQKVAKIKKNKKKKYKESEDFHLEDENPYEDE